MKLTMHERRRRAAVSRKHKDKWGALALSYLHEAGPMTITHLVAYKRMANMPYSYRWLVAVLDELQAARKVWWNPDNNQWISLAHTRADPDE